MYKPGRKPTAMPRQQRGAALIVIVAGLVAMLAVAGLVLDGGHLMLNKTRLQNTVDAASLAAARALDQSGDAAQATAAALTVFGRNADAGGNHELAESYSGGSGDVQLAVQYSETLQPFVPGAPTGPYVRVIANGFTLPAWLAQVVGITEKRVRASAVAGPSPTIDRPVCNVAPMTVCGNPDAGVTENSYWGYELNSPVVMKTSAGGAWDSTPGPGNFLLVRLGEGQGGSAVREGMAGSYNACVGEDEDFLETEPGNTIGPVAQGMNTRFGQYQGPVSASEFPPDVIVTSQAPPLSSQDNAIYQGGTQITSENIDLLYNYQDYMSDLMSPDQYDYDPISDGGIGAYERRVLAVPIADCSTASGGSGQVGLLGFACFFLLQPVNQQGNDAEVFGQFVGDCTVTGSPGPAPGAGAGPYIIQLYKDPDSGDS